MMTGAAARSGRRLGASAVVLAALLTGGCGVIASNETPREAGQVPSSQAPAAAAGAASPAEATLRLFAALADDEPGCSVAVNVEGRIVLAEAYGAASLDPLEPFGISTVVDIGSSSKQFTAIAVGRLIVDGDVAPDDPVDRYVEGLPRWAEEVTVAQLLTHTSGIPDYIDLLVDAGVELTDPSDQADALKVLAEQKTLDQAPGTGFEYSNSNYVLLAEVVAAASGRDLPSWLDAELFGPLDLDAAMTPGVALPDKAVSYEFDDDDGWVVADSPWTQVGDGAVQTTPSALAAFATTYWLDGYPWDELTALRDELAVDAETGAYSLGIETVEVDGMTLLSHEGSWAGFETQFLVAPDERVAVALTCNSPDVGVDLDGLDGQILDLWLP